MSTPLKKFMFETNFDDAPEAESTVPEPEQPEEEEPEPEIIVPTFSEQDLNTAREDGFTAGKQEGQQETSVSVEARIAETLAAIDTKCADLFQTQENDSDELSRAAVSMSMEVARKIVPSLAEDTALNEIEQIIRSVFEKIVEEPHVTINVHPELAGDLGGRIESMSKSRTYEGNIHVQPDESIATGDCRLEWSNGGTERDTAALWRDIDEIIDKYLEGRPTVWTRPDETAPAPSEKTTPEQPEAATVEAAATEPEIETKPETDD